MLLNAARLLLLGPLLLAPWLLGSAEPHLNRWLVWPIAASGLAWLLHAKRSPHTVPCQVPRVGYLTLAGALLGVVQCLPVWNPDSAWSPGVAQLWGDLGVLGVGERAPGTLYANATCQQVAWLIIAALVATLGPALFASRRALIWLFGALAVNGGLLAAMMFAQFASWNGRIYWIGPLLDRDTPAFGPFVYHNQAANSFAIALACLAGWWLASTEHRERTARFDQDRDPLLLGGPRWLRAGQLFCGSLLVLGILLAESRGAVIAAFAALGAGLIARFPRARIGRTAQIGIVASLAIGAAIIWVAGGDGPVDRYASLLEDDTLTEDSRLATWKDAARASTAVGALGGGLGAYGHTTQAFQREPTTFEFRNAHNQYLEALVNGGPLAIGLLVAAIAVALMDAFPASRSVRRTVGSIGLTALLIVVFQAAHAVVDFCLYLPASFLPTALVVGLLGSATLLGSSRSRSEKETPPKAFGAVSLAVVGLVLITPVAAAFLQRVGTIDRRLATLPIERGRLEATTTQLDAYIEALERALAEGSLADRLTPRDAVAYETLGDLRVVRYGRAARAAIAEELGIDPSDPSLEPWTTPSVLFRKAYEALLAGDGETLEAIREQDLVEAHLLRAHEAYAKASRSCPMLERAATRRVELSFCVPEFEDTDYLDAALATAQRIGGMRPDSLFSIGNLSLLADRPERAWEAWRACLAISSRWQSAIVQRAAAAMPVDRLVTDLLPRDPERLVRIGSQTLITAPLAVARAATLAEAERLLSSPDADTEFSLRAGKRWSLIAECRRLAGDPQGAINALDAALQENPSRVGDRFKMAQLLAETGRLEAALREAQFCARAKPSSAAYASLARRLAKAALERPGSGG